MLKILNPATNSIVAEIAEDGFTAVREKYLRARAAQPRWAATPIRKRLAAIRGFRERLTAMQETLARTLTQEVGKPIRQSRNELQGLLARIDFFLAEAAQRAARREGATPTRRGGSRNGSRMNRWESIANISAWNYPYFVGGNVFVPALLAGNAVLYKPSEFATLTGLHIAKLLHEAGVPEDVFVPVIGGGRNRCRDAAATGRRNLLHRLVRNRRENRRRRRAEDDQGPARIGRQGSDLRLRRCRCQGRRRGDRRRRVLQHRPVAAARSSASTYTRRYTTPSSTHSSPK